LLYTTSFKRPFDAGPIRKRIELANSKNPHDNSLDDVAQRPAKHDDSNREQKVRQQNSYLGNKRVPKTGHGDHRIHNFPPLQQPPRSNY
jgi:hypothetical protein